MKKATSRIIILITLLLVGCGGNSSQQPNEPEPIAATVTSIPDDPEPVIATFTSEPDEEVAEESDSDAEIETPTATASAEAEPTATSTVEPTPTATLEPSPTATLVLEEDILSSANLAPTYLGADELSLIFRINAYRVSLGLWPLHYDPRLQVMAVDQANYLNEQIDQSAFPDYQDIHVGRTGAYIQERALLFDWTFYSNRDQVNAGEIAYVGWEVDTAVSFWSGSSIHNNTMTGTGYRYIGAKIVESKIGDVFIVVFGSEANDLPVLLDTSQDIMYLTTERYAWAVSDKFIKEVTEVRISPDGETGDFEPYELTKPLPDYADETFYVTFTDGNITLTTEVSPLNDRAWLPGLLD